MWGASIPTALLKEPEATAVLTSSTGVGAIPWDPLVSKGLLRQLCLSLGQKVSEMIKDPAQRFLGKKAAESWLVQLKVEVTTFEAEEAVGLPFLQLGGESRRIWVWA